MVNIIEKEREGGRRGVVMFTLLRRYRSLVFFKIIYIMEEQKKRL